MYLPPSGPVDKLYGRLIQAQKVPVLGSIIRQALKLRGIDIPPATLRPGRGIILRHAGNVVVHVKSRIGDNVMLHQGVTVGRADIWKKEDPSFEGFAINDHVILGANAVVVGKTGLLEIGEGTVLGANSVLTKSTGAYEIWAGAPAQCIGTRPRDQ